MLFGIKVIDMPVIQRKQKLFPRHKQHKVQTSLTSQLQFAKSVMVGMHDRQRPAPKHAVFLWGGKRKKKGGSILVP